MVRRERKVLSFAEVLGEHPTGAPQFGATVTASDAHTDSGVPHRMLTEVSGQRDAIVAHVRDMLVRHHVSPEALERDRQRRDAMRRLGFDTEQTRMRRFPTNPSTQKGNLAEVILAEYIVSATGTDLPVYRLRYNPNINQSMKGDDVLAFDVDSNPVRIIVGEAKFRSTSSKAAVTEIVEGLVRSHRGGIPVSLQFVADRLFETGRTELGEKVLACATLFAMDKLQLDYVGLLMSDTRSAARLSEHTENAIHRLAVISLGIDRPDAIVEPCYSGLED